MMGAVEQAFSDHRKAQNIREAIAYVKVWTNVGDDPTLQWADGEVLDAAAKYADHLERQAYRGPDALVVERGLDGEWPDWAQRAVSAWVNEDGTPRPDPEKLDRLAEAAGEVRP